MALKDQPRSLRSIQIKLGVGLFVVATGTWLFAVRPMERQIGDLQASTAQAMAQLDQCRTYARQLPALKTEVKALQRQVDRFKPLPPRSDLSQAFQDIGGIGGLGTVRDYYYAPAEEKRNDLYGFCEAPFKVSFDADFESAYALIARLESMERLTRMRELTIRRKTAGSGEVHVDLKLSLFFAE